MYKVEFKSHNAGQAWMGHGTYGSESSALQNASRIALQKFMVRVVDPQGNVIFSGGSGR